MAYNTTLGVCVIKGANGYGDYKIPSKFIKIDTYKALYSVTDLDSYRDANGELHRNALEHRIAKVEFETPAMLTNTDVAELMGEISKRYTVAKERKLVATMYMPETDAYVQQNVYIPDINYQMYSGHTGKIQFESFRIAFIGY